MVRVVVANEATRSQVKEECIVMMQEVSMAISDAHGVSLLSSATIIFQVASMLVETMGGNASRGFMASCLDAQFLNDPRQMAKIEKRCMAQMQKMAEHYDLLTAKSQGSA